MDWSGNLEILSESIDWPDSHVHGRVAVCSSDIYHSSNLFIALSSSTFSKPHLITDPAERTTSATTGNDGRNSVQPHSLLRNELFIPRGRTGPTAFVCLAAAMCRPQCTYVFWWKLYRYSHTIRIFMFLFSHLKLTTCWTSRLLKTEEKFS